MLDVYGISFLAISVTRSPDSGGGSFASRPSMHASMKAMAFEHRGTSNDILAREPMNYLSSSSDHVSDVETSVVFAGLDVPGAATAVAHRTLHE